MSKETYHLWVYFKRFGENCQYQYITKKTFCGAVWQTMCNQFPNISTLFQYYATCIMICEIYSEYRLCMAYQRESRIFSVNAIIMAARNVAFDDSIYDIHNKSVTALDLLEDEFWLCIDELFDGTHIVKFSSVVRWQETTYGGKKDRKAMLSFYWKVSLIEM